MELLFYNNNKVNSLIPSLKNQIKPLVIAETIKALDLTNLTIEISKLLDQNEIRYLILKGIPLSLKTLKLKSSRGRGDLDLFIEKSNLQDTINALNIIGFKLYKTSLPNSLESKRGKFCLWANYETSLIRKSKKGSEYIDLHWELSYVKDNLPTFEACWKDKQEIKISNFVVKTLSYEHEFILSCAHSAKDKWMSIRNLIDIDRLARTIYLKKINVRNISKQIKMSSLITYNLTKGEYLTKYINCGFFLKAYSLRVASYFIRIDAKKLSKNGWTPFSRVMNVLHRLLLTNNPEDWLKIIIVNLVTPESIVNLKNREVNSIQKIFLNRVYSLKNALKNYFVKK